MIYTITVANTGSSAIDADSIFLVDNLPAEITFYNGDIDDGGPETGPIEFNENTSGLTFNPATDLGFSNAATAPADMSACTYTPSAGYDPNITYLCIAPQGAMSEGAITPSSFDFSFRAMIE